MLIIGCDYHPGFQQIALVDTETGELSERRLAHREEAEQSYDNLREQGLKVRVGMEASGHSRLFERWLREVLAGNTAVNGFMEENEAPKPPRTFVRRMGAPC